MFLHENWFSGCTASREFAQDVSVASLSGGASRKRQLENLKVKPKIVVGTRSCA